MTLRKATLAFAVALGIACTTLTGCDLILTPTKTANGQLYQSGDGKYDPYFAAVHQEQVAAANWADEAKASRKPIVTALDLRPGASNSVILSATRSKKGEGSLGSAIEQTTAAERERARRLSAAAAKLEDLEKHGEELRKQAVEERRNLAADKADEKKVAKKDELKREIAAAVDAVDSLASDARKGAKEAEELATKLKAAWTGRADDERPPVKTDEKKEEKLDEKKEEKKPEPVAKKAPKTSHPVARKPAAPKAEADRKPAEEKPAKPQPAQKPADEVFNP